MRRYSLLLLLLFGIPAHGQPVATAASSWDSKLAAQVYLTALTFIAPRTLEPVALAQLTIWGLRGLTALDPALSVESRDGQLILSSAGRVLARLPVPTAAEDRPAAWVDATIVLSNAAWNASVAVRRAGTTGILRAYFDELFNHLDPYSRYVPPYDAGDDRARRTGLAGAGITPVPPGQCHAGQIRDRRRSSGIGRPAQRRPHSGGR